MSTALTPGSAGERYVGRENLEVMETAVNYNRWLVQLAIDSMAGARPVLDFGAGSGTLTRMLKAAGVDLSAVEPDPDMAANLISAGVPAHRSLDTVPDGTIAGIVSFNVLEHIEDDAAALRALHSKLMPGGRLFLYVPAFQILYSSMDRLVGHFRRYRRRQLATQLAKAGFHVVSSRYADSLGFLASLAFRAFGNSSGHVNPSAVRLYDRVAFPASRVLDTLSCGTFGKNVMAIATKPG